MIRVAAPLEDRELELMCDNDRILLAKVAKSNQLSSQIILRRESIDFLLNKSENLIKCNYRLLKKSKQSRSDNSAPPPRFVLINFDVDNVDIADAETGTARITKCFNRFLPREYSPCLYID